VTGTQEIVVQPENSGACARSGSRGGLDAADLLSLAATPTFAMMALLTGVVNSSAMDMRMVTMYLLMSVFHSAHWLKLVLNQRSRYRRPWSGVRWIERWTVSSK